MQGASTPFTLNLALILAQGLGFRVWSMWIKAPQGFSWVSCASGPVGKGFGVGKRFSNTAR